jgi:putative endonuclease
MLYTGVTNHLIRRVAEHKQKLISGFTKRYNMTRLVYYEVTGDIQAAIAREKRIKGWTHRRKMALIRTLNPDLCDLSDEWLKDDSESETKAK